MTETDPIEGTPEDMDWRRRLLAQCAEAIAALPERPPSDAPPEPVREPPSLYEYFEEVVALRTEVRRGNRKTAETFSKFGEVLEGMREDSVRLRERLGRPRATEAASGTPRNLALAMVDVCDRVIRLEDASRSHIGRGWLDRLRSASHWKQQAGALSILHEHLQGLLAEAGVRRIDATPGQAFDPRHMKAVDRRGPGPAGGEPLVVEEELLPGYRLGDHCLRPAEVRLATQPSATT
jgi:hypothetical protein